MDRLEHRRAAGMDVTRRRHAQTTLQRAADVGDDVAEQVVGDDHLKLIGTLHEQHRERIDIEVRRLDVRISRREPFEDALPERVPVRHRVALVGHADLRQAPRLRELERVLDDAVNAAIRVHLLLNRDLVLGVRPHPAAGADIEAFGVLPKHHEVDVAARAVLQRAETIVKQPDGPVVHVQIELEARAEQDVARVTVVRDARVAKRADEDRVEGPQRVVPAARNRDAGLQVIVGAPRQLFEGATPDRPQDVQGLWNHFAADSISGHDRH